MTGWWNLLWLIPAALVGVILWASWKNRKSSGGGPNANGGGHGGHDDHGGHHAVVETKGTKTLAVLGTICVTLIVIWVVSVVGLVVVEVVSAVTRSNTPQSSYSAPTAPKYIPCQSGNWRKKSFDVPKSGLALPLCQGWVSTPFGGPITIHLKDGRVKTDEPGKKLDLGYVPDGVVIFYPEPIDSRRSVDIDNLWEN